jgi:hypothetical protein
MQSIFYTILSNDPNFICVKDQNNMLKSILLLKPVNHEIKYKFAKYLLMKDKTFFYNAQKLYHILLRFIQKCKLKKIKAFDIDCDLRLAPLVPETKIELLENKQIYPFNIYDLLNIISTALLNQNNLFANPQYPKNPYTNLNLRFHNLYNIYIRCLDLKIKIPTIITYFCNCGFCLSVFFEKYKPQLCEWAIDTYLSNDTNITDNIIEDMYDMCYVYNIRIHKEFPIKKLFLILRPYLKNHYNHRNKNETEKMMDCFILYNPFFGRKYRTSDGQIVFDDRHLPFQQIKNGIFKDIWNTKIFNKLNANKYKYNNVYCVSLPPINGVEEEEEEDYYEEEEDYYDEEEDDYDP